MKTTTVLFNNTEIHKMYHNFIFNSLLKCKKFHLIKPLNQKSFYCKIVFYFQTVGFDSKPQIKRFYSNAFKINLIAINKNQPNIDNKVYWRQLNNIYRAVFNKVAH
jgi:hypothetical protein